MRVVFCDIGAHCKFNRDGKCLKEMIKLKNGQCYLLFDTCNDKMIEELIEEGEWREWDDSNASSEESQTGSTTESTSPTST